MSFGPRAVATLLLASGAVFAQEPHAYRLTGAERAVQIRLAVVTPGGTTLYDSDWRGGNIVDFSAATLPYGSYQLRISSRDVDGKLTEKETTLQVSADRITIDPALPDDLKLTTTAHDGTTGQLITTSGDLSFRFGDYLKGKDSEAMRLSPEGNLDVKGWIRPAQGILFPDGSVITSAFVDASGRTRASRGATTDSKKLTPRIEASGTGTMNQIAKWIDSAGTLGDSVITESGANIGLGTTTPNGRLHIFGPATADVFAGMGVDMVAGPAFNFGYGGASFGRSAGFFNVRPDGSAVAPNPSLRFLTANTERMIITNLGNIGIGTSTPGGKLQVFAAPTADVFAGFGTDMSAGPSMNFGYGGATFGRGAGFFNARPDASATAPNPSLRFMTANVERMIITSTGSVGIGTSAPGQKLDVAGTVSVTGNLALPATASSTVGVITLGGPPFAHAFGSNNTFVGRSAGNFTMTGGNNTVTGVGPLVNNSTGFNNTSSGVNSLFSNTTGSNNTASGIQALFNNTTGNDNTASGVQALFNNTTGNDNAASGVAALDFNTTGSNNTAVGFQTLVNNGIESSNIGIGYRGGYNLTIGDNNIDIGSQGVAAESNTIRIGTDGVQTQTFLVGTVSVSNNLVLPVTAAGGTAGVITLAGNRLLHAFTASPQSNLFLGQGSGNFTLVAVGRNTGLGDGTLQSLTFGNDNTAVGHIALQFDTFGNSNTAVGRIALLNNTSGSGNLALGTGAGSNLTTGNDNIDIANQGVAAEAATIRIGTDGTQTRAFIAGIRGVTTGVGDALIVQVDSNGQLGTASSSIRTKFDIADMRDATNGLMRLRPVTFRYLAHGANARLQYGLIAEEVADVYPELVALDKDGQPETVMYQFLAPMLLNEVQKQHQTITDQQKTIDVLTTTLATVAERLAVVERQLTKSH